VRPERKPAFSGDLGRVCLCGFQVSQWYDLVVFTASMEIYGAAVAEKLDRNRGILKRRYYRQVGSNFTSLIQYICFAVIIMRLCNAIFNTLFRFHLSTVLSFNLHRVMTELLEKMGKVR